MADAPNIHDHVAAICETLGLEPDFVAELDITPSTVTATVYKRNEHGSKYVEFLDVDGQPLPDDDPMVSVTAYESRAATEQHTYAVTA